MTDKNFKVKSGIQVPALSTAGVVVTDASGNISSASVLPVANGGTGQTTANNALNALLPIQNGSTVNYALQSDGSNTLWGKLYHQTFKNAGTTINPRTNVNFINASFTDNSTSDTVTITLPPLNLYSRETFTATAAQTSFALSNPGIVGFEQVFLNGILLVKDSDYTTPTSSSVVLATGASSGDSLEVMVLRTITSYTSYYQTLKNSGTAVTQRPSLNVIGATLTDDSANDQTVMTIDQPLKASLFMLMGV